MSNIQLIGHADGSVSLVCVEHPEFQLKLGYSVSPSVAFRYANSHYINKHMERDGLSAHRAKQREGAGRVGVTTGEPRSPEHVGQASDQPT